MSDATTLTPLFDLYRTTPGRAIHAARRVDALAGTGQDAIREAAARVIEAGQGQLDLERRWQIYRNQRDRVVRKGEARRLDGEVDRWLTSFERGVGALRELRGADSDFGRTATRVLEQALPAGATALTQLSYEEQLEGTRELTALLQGELADDITTLGLADDVATLAALVTDFSAAVVRERGEGALSYDDVLRGRADVHERLLGLVVTILGKYPGSDARDTRQRVRLMAPIMEHNEEIGRARRRRRAANDVDPETGAVIDDDAPLTPDEG